MFLHKLAQRVCFVMLIICSLVITRSVPASAQESESENLAITWQTNQENVDELFKQIEGSGLSIEQVTDEEIDKNLQPFIEFSDETMTVDGFVAGLKKLQSLSSNSESLVTKGRCSISIRVLIQDNGNGTSTVSVNALATS